MDQHWEVGFWLTPVCVCVCVDVCVCSGAYLFPQHIHDKTYMYVCIYIFTYWAVLKRLVTPSIFHCLQLFHSPIVFLSLIAVYIPSFQVLRGWPHFQLITVFGNRIRSILSTWPYRLVHSLDMTIPFGPFSWYDQTKWVVFGLSHAISYLARSFFL